MNRVFKSALIAASVVSCLPASAVMISQNVDNNVITAGNSVSCNGGGLHTDNWYARGFNLADFGITQPFQVSSVRFGVEQATGTGGSQNVTVNLYDGYSVSGSVLTPGALLASQSVSVSNGSAFFQVTGISGLVTSGRVVAEIFTPNGQSAGNSFFIGSNNLGQTGPSFLKAPDCGVTSLTSLAAIGFPGMHELISLEGSAVPEPGTMIALSLGAAALLRRRKKA